jgi:prepilin-type N-terminal cleavage/methylation domain-containing protein
MPMTNTATRYKEQGASSASITSYNLPLTTSRGYTLIELMVAVGLFALIMTLASGAYLMMISINRQTQNITAGINDLSFALETMVRSIRTGTGYNCGSPNCSSGDSFYFTNTSGASVSYDLAGSTIQQVVDGVISPLTDPVSVTVNSLTFYVSGTEKPPANYEQPHVTIIVSGEISPGRGKPPESFTIETGATMRGADL